MQTKRWGWALRCCCDGMEGCELKNVWVPCWHGKRAPLTLPLHQPSAPRLAPTHACPFPLPAWLLAQGYHGYYEQLLQLVRPGGVIAVDNVLWYGKVADLAATDGATLALRELNAFLLEDERVTLSIVPVGDGMALCTKR